MKLASLIVCFAAGSSMFAQRPPEAAKPKPARMTVQVLEVRPRPAPQPAAGEYVEIDRAAGVAHVRSLGRDGNFRTWQIHLAGLVEPEVRTAVEVRDGGAVLYRYWIRNGPGARQDIYIWLLDVEDGNAVKLVRVPEGWDQPTYNLLPNRHSLGWSIQYGTGNALKPGGARPEFVLESPWLPGLKEACFVSPENVKFPEDFYLASEWAYLTVEERLKDRVCQPVIAPKIRPRDSRLQLLQAIRNELVYASGMDEFASIRVELESFAAAILAPGRPLPPMPAGKTALQADFLTAMALNISAALSRPD